MVHSSENDGLLTDHSGFNLNEMKKKLHRILLIVSLILLMKPQSIFYEGNRSQQKDAIWEIWLALNGFELVPRCWRLD